MAKSKRKTRLIARVEVARQFGVSARTVARWLREGMPAGGQAGGYFDVKKIEAWLAARGVRRAKPPRICRSESDDFEQRLRRRDASIDVLIDQCAAIIADVARAVVFAFTQPRS
jgi:hypothetical protein